MAVNYIWKKYTAKKVYLTERRTGSLKAFNYTQSTSDLGGINGDPWKVELKNGDYYFKASYYSTDTYNPGMTLRDLLLSRPYYEGNAAASNELVRSENEIDSANLQFKPGGPYRYKYILERSDSDTSPEGVIGIYETTYGDYKDVEWVDDQQYQRIYSSNYGNLPKPSYSEPYASSYTIENGEFKLSGEFYTEERNLPNYSSYSIYQIDKGSHGGKDRLLRYDVHWSSYKLKQGTPVHCTLDHTTSGNYITTVKSTSRSAYPDNGEQGGYYYVYQGVDNQPPTISGSNLDLGSKQDDFEIEYTVSDPDKNPCTVDIIVDTVKKISSKSVVLNTKYTYPVKIDEFSLGKHTITITAKDSNGATTSRKYTFTKSNTAPIISGNDKDLGEKSTAFTEEYSVTDRNNDNVDITVTLDDLEISNISSAQNKSLSFTISNEQLLKFEIGSSHTITIKADDGKGGVAYRRYTFIKANRPPIISDTDKDLGEKKESFSINYSLSDVEKDKIYTRIYLDGKQVFENLEVVDGKSYKYTIEKDVFLSLNYGRHEIRIEAWDDNSVDNKQVRTYTFERVQNGLTVEIKINEFDVQPKKIIAVPHGIFASDATISVFACNNYNDTKPKWEPITESSKAARAYSFTNTTKTASKWAIGVVIKVENGKSGVSSVLRGVKGGYE